MTKTQRAAIQQALEAMLHFPGDISDEMFESIRSLKAALAEPEPEPEQRTVMTRTSDSGWLEAAIAWNVCASIHYKFAKRKDPFYSTRHIDFVTCANEARKKARASHAAYAAGEAAGMEACAKLIESRKIGASELMDTVRDMEAAAIRKMARRQK